MLHDSQNQLKAIDNGEALSIKERQIPNKKGYEQSPETAIVTDHARSRSDKIPASQPLYGSIEMGESNKAVQDFALHEGVGGDGGLPVPGDIFCGAIASCLDSAIRVVANHLGIQLAKLEVQVEGDVDLRGTLRIDPDVPVWFQHIRVNACIIPEDDVPAATLEAILAAAEYSCVILQTLRNMPDIQITRS